MAKKRQTTGLPKPTKKIQETSETQRKFRSRAEREEEIQRWVTLGIGIAIAVIVLVIGVAYVYEEVITPRRAVANVNGETITVAEFERRVRMERVIAIELVNNGINTIMEVGGMTDPNQAFSQLLQLDGQTAQFFGIAPNASQLWTELNSPDQLGIRVLDEMVDDLLIREEAEARGITVTQEDIQREIDGLFGVDREAILALEPEETPDAESTAEITAEATESAEETEEPTRVFVSPTPSPVPTETATPTVTPTLEQEPTTTLTPIPTLTPVATQTVQEQIEEIDDRIDSLLDRLSDETGMSRNEIDNFFEGLALRTALLENMVDEDGMGTFVNARHILVATEEEALDVIDSLNAGESFSALARAVSTDTGSGANGGELSWSPVINYVDEFAEAVTSAPVGEIVGPVETQFGFHVIQVNAREERELTESQVELQSQRAFETWLQEARESEENNIVTHSIWTDHVPDDPPFFYQPR